MSVRGNPGKQKNMHAFQREREQCRRISAEKHFVCLLEEGWQTYSHGEESSVEECADD